MAVDSLNVELNLDDEDFRKGMESAVSFIKKLNGVLGDSDERLNRNRSVIRAWGKAVRGSLTELYSLQQLTAPIVNGVASITNRFIRANAEFEKTTAILGGLSGSATSVSEATENLDNELERLEELATRTPFTMQALQNSMVKLKAGGIDNLDFSMQALIDSVARFGGGANELDRASIAIQQMAGKGVVSMEELRQQLGEAVPNAMALMARGLGLSMAELAKLVESGTLEATGALQAMFTEMALVNDGAAEDMTKTWYGTMSQISARIDQIMRDIGDTGLFDELKSQAQALLDYLNQPETLDFFLEIGEGLREAIENTISFIKYVDELNVAMDILRDIVIAIAFTKFSSSLKVVGKSIRGAVDGLDDMITAVKNVGTPLKTMNKELDKQKRLTQASLAQFGMYNSKIILARDATQRTKIAVAGLNGVMRNAASLASTVGKSALTMAGPIGGAVAIVLELASAFNLFGNEVDNIREKAGDRTIAISAEEYTKLARDVASAKEQVTQLNQDLEKQNEILENSSYGSTAASTAALEASSIKSTLSQLSLDISEGEAALKIQNNLMASNVADSFTDAFKASFGVVGRQLKIDYNKALSEISDLRNNPGVLSGEALNAELARMKDVATNTLIERRTAAARAAAEELYIATKSGIEKADIDETARANQLKGLEIGYKEELAAISKWEKELLEQITKVRGEGIKTLSVSDEFWTKSYESAFVDLAGWQAKLEGGNVRYAKSLAKSVLDAKENATYTRAQAEALGVEVEKIKLAISARKDLVSIQEKAVKSTAKLTDELKEQTNPYLASITSLESMGEKLNELVNTQTKWKLSTGEIVDLTKEQEAAIAAVRAEMTAQSLVDISKQTAEIQAQTAKINEQKMSEKELAALKKQKSVEEIQNLRTAAEALTVYSRKVKDPELKASILDQAQALVELSNAMGKPIPGQQSQFSELMTSWGEITTQMDGLWTNSMTSMSSSLADFVATGKADFTSLANSIIKQLIQISIQAAASQIFGSYLGIGAGVSTAGVATASAGAQSLQSYGQSGAAIAPQSVGSFASPNATTLSSSMPTTPSGNQAPSVAVNVINETGTEADAEQGGMKFDGERWVLDVVMKAMNRPGNFRSAMKGNTRQ